MSQVLAGAGSPDAGPCRRPPLPGRLRRPARRRTAALPRPCLRPAGRPPAGQTSHPALLAFARADAAFVRASAGGAAGRIVLLARLDERLRRDTALTLELALADEPGRVRLLRTALLRERDRRRVELARLAALETLHREEYDAAVDAVPSTCSRALREDAAATYASVYPRMVVVVALAVLDHRLTGTAVRDALAARRWPACLPLAPRREGSTDLMDQLRSPRAAQTSADAHLDALDEDDGRPDLRVVRRLATHEDAPATLVAREELLDLLQALVAEYRTFAQRVAALPSAESRRRIALVLAGASSADVCAQLVAEGHAEVTANAIDRAWTRALSGFALLPVVLGRRRPDFRELVELLERSSQAAARA